MDQDYYFLDYTVGSNVWWMVLVSKQIKRKINLNLDGIQRDVPNITYRRTRSISF